MTDPTPIAQYRALARAQCEDCVVLALVMRGAMQVMDLGLAGFIAETVAGMEQDDMPWDPADIQARVEFMRASLRGVMTDVLDRVPANPGYDLAAKDRAC